MKYIYIRFVRGFILSFFLLSVFFASNAQQLPYYTQYHLNQVALNPATAGAYSYSGVNLTMRKDWIGFKGSPSTFTMSGDHRFNSNVNPFGGKASGGTKGNIGVGGALFNDVNGALSRFGFKAVYAYHIQLYRSQMSFGLALTGYQLKLDMDKIDFIQDGDPLVQQISSKAGVFSPDASIGAHYLNNDYYFGIAADQLMQNAIKFGDRSLGLRLLRHYYVVGGYSYEAHPDYIIEPSIFLKVNERLDIQSDFTAKLVYKDQYWGGFNYRTNNDFTFLVGMKYEFFYIAYSYDFNSNPVLNYNFNSHEISLGARFSTGKKGPSGSGYRSRY